MGLSTCAKGAIACGVCTAVILAIMIPVGILVIAPALGQHALSSATMEIPNCTVYNLPPDLTVDPDGGRIANFVDLTQKSFPFNSKLVETNMIMHLAPGNSNWQDPDTPFAETDLAWFTLPEQIVKHGLTEFQFDQQLEVLNAEVFATMAFGLVLQVTPTVEIWIVGKPKLVALGFVEIGPLRLGKKMLCAYDASLNPEAESGNLESRSKILTGRRLQGLPPIGLVCNQTGNLKDEEIDALMDNRTSDGGFYTMTTTTAPPTTTTSSVATPAPVTTTKASVTTTAPAATTNAVV